VQIKRAYEPAGQDDGHRVLIDRLWPRGISKDGLAVEAWLKELAPSQELRQWFAHDPARWEEFRRRYRAELEALPQQAWLRALARHAAAGTHSLVYAARDEQRNNAAVLKELIEEELRLQTPA
jgi:uncharacterized protein YeaO (DUF488 family)